MKRVNNGVKNRGRLGEPRDSGRHNFSDESSSEAAQITERLCGTSKGTSREPGYLLTDWNKASFPNLLNEYDVAWITGLSVGSVRRWRLFRKGPKYLKIGAAVRYKPESVSAWLESRPTGGGEVTGL